MGSGGGGVLDEGDVSQKRYFKNKIVKFLGNYM